MNNERNAIAEAPGWFVNKNRHGIVLPKESHEEAMIDSHRYSRIYNQKFGRSDSGPMFSAVENILSGEVGLHIPPDHTTGNVSYAIPESEIENEHIFNPLWVMYNFINGSNDMMIGHHPTKGFGAHFIEPDKTRKILEGNYSSLLLDEVRNSTRKYTIEVHNWAKKFINDIIDRHDISEKINQHLSPDQFEEFIADLLRAQGFDVFLTSRTRDGGKDIWAAFEVNRKKILTLVECKMRNGKASIDPSLSRAVVGSFFVHQRQGIDVTHALLVTNSNKIGPETLKIEQQVNEFSIKDADAITQWVSKYGSIKNGLWVPDSITSNLI